MFAPGGKAAIQMEGLVLVPDASFESVQASSSFTTYVASAHRPQFRIVGLLADMPPGMYRLDMETTDALDILDASIFLAECGDELLPLRATFERFPDRISAFFLLPPKVSALGFLPHMFASAELHVGAIGLTRVSTTRRRAQRMASALRRSATPGGLWRTTVSLGRTLRHEGPMGLVRGWAELTNPTLLLPVVQPAEALTDAWDANWFMRTIDIHNRNALRKISPTPVVDPTPSLSIVVPVYRTATAWLGELLDSLTRQTDANFELVLVFDGPQPKLRDFAEHRLKGRDRTRLVTLDRNGGAAAASNAGIEAATGDYVLVVDHDDVVERNLVAAFRTAARNSPADVYVADEAITDGDMKLIVGVATRGKFDIRYYLSHPYFVHPIFIRRDLIIEAGFLDPTLRVSHDVDLMLRCLAKARNVVQIPLVLYFWRTHARSLGHTGIGEVAINTKAAIRRYIEQTTNWASFEVLDGANFNEYDVRPPLPSGSRVAIVIPTKNRLGFLSTCLASLHSTAANNEVKADIYVVDHESDDPRILQYLAAEEAAGRISVLRYRGAWNFSAINNWAVETILGRRSYSHLAFMNNDIEIVTDDWLDRLVAQFSYADVGVVGCCLQYPNGLVQHAGVVVGLVDAAEHAHKFERLTGETTGRRYPSHLCSLVATRDYNAVTAAMMVVSTPLFQAVNGFDERLAVGFNDTDLCLRIGALGFRSTYVGGVLAVHFESMSRGHAPHLDDTALFRERYGDMIENGDDYWAAMLDRARPSALVTTKSQKPFRLVETVLSRASSI